MSAVGARSERGGGPESGTRPGGEGRPATARRGAALLLTLGATTLSAACSENGGTVIPPGAEFRPETVAASIYSLRFASRNVALAQVGLISEALGLATPSAALVARDGSARRIPPATRLVAPESGEGAGTTPRRIRPLAAPRSASAASGSVPLFPINFLGRTFVYDAGADAYVADDGLPGAPPDGVRFLLYTLDASGLPALPLFQIGYVDLIDASDAGATRLAVRAFDTTGGRSLPLADYVLDGAFAVDGAALTVSLLSDGFLHDVDGRFDFELDELLEADETTDATIVSILHRVVSAEGTEVTLSVEGELANDGSRTELDFLMEIVGPSGVTTVDLTVSDGFQEGTIRHGAKLEAQVGGTVSSPEFVDADGRGFTLSELDALDEILFGIDDILILADELFLPLAGLFGVG